MNVHFTFKAGKTPDIEKEINHYIEKLQKRVQVFRPELVHLKGLVEQNSVREGFVVSLNLRLPSGQMASHEHGHSLIAVIKAAFDDLFQQLIKHKSLLSNLHYWRRKRIQSELQELQEPATSDQPAEAEVAFAVSADEIRSYINANLPRLERFVERQLRFRENTDQLAPDSLSVDEVVDEAVANALGDGHDKPQPLAVEPWLYRLAIRAMDGLSQHTFEEADSVPLEKSARPANVRASDEPQLQYHQPDEQLIEQDIIRDSSSGTPEEIAASDELISQVEGALQGMAHEDREAFILYAIEGFTLEEIAAIADRKPEEVRTSIIAAREGLQKSLPLGNQFKEKLLQHSKVA